MKKMKIKTRSVFEKLLSGLLLAAMVIGLIPTGIVAKAAAEVPANGLVAEYFFAERPSDGKTIKNQATGTQAVGDAIVQNESTAQWKDRSLVFSGEGTSNTAPGTWVSLPQNILSGKNSATISIEVKASADIISKNHFLWNIGNSSTDTYWFMNTKDPRATIKYDGNEKIASGQTLTAERWYSLTSVIDADTQTLTFYIDGKKAGEVKDNAMSLTKVSDQSRNTIGRAPYNDPMFKGSVSTFRVYDRALSSGEVAAISDKDSSLHSDYFKQLAKEAADALEDVTITDANTMLPSYNNTVTWTSKTDAVTISEDGLTAAAVQPANGGDPVTGTLTATVNMRGQTAKKDVTVTIQPEKAPEDPYGYMMVHFIEDADGYAEKIYLDISRGDNPEYWDPLNGGQPILSSSQGTTGVRDPYLTYNPETKTYYIIGTDLRVFGGNIDYHSGNSGWAWNEWSRVGSTKMNIWESKDLINWSRQRQFDVALDESGKKLAELGMMWAPEATWVPDYYGEGKGAFVVYWSSTTFADSDPEHTGARLSSDIMWGATTDFTQETWEYGGRFLNGGSAGWIDTTMIQNGEKTYHITKSHADQIILEVTSDKQWWKEGTHWTRIQSRIGESRFGGLEGPAVFKDHNRDDHWYLFVDDMPEPGYQLMESYDLDQGWQYLESSNYFLTKNTKHGGVISLTKGQYDAIRKSDAKSAVNEVLGTVKVNQGAAADAVLRALPKTAKAESYYNYGTAELPVQWDISRVDTAKTGTYKVTGTLETVGANLNQWVGKDGSTKWNAQDKKPYSSTAITVEAAVTVEEPRSVWDVFEDVNADDWFVKSVQYVYDNRIMTGMDVTHFGPAVELSRAMFATMLYRMEQEPDITYDADIFPDVADQLFYTKAVMWANKNGIVTGYKEEGLFRPEKNITREEMVTMLYRYANYKGIQETHEDVTLNFPDAGNITEYAVPAVKWAVKAGIISGNEDGTLAPQGLASRGQCAAMIERYMK